MILRTSYTIGKIPHSEHPRPQAKRKDWLCLNGEWSFVKYNQGNEKLFEGKIIVPFSPETINSGLEPGFVLKPLEYLVYERTVKVDETLLRGTTILHFDAVDSECTIYVNGVLVGGHVGGYTAFSLDISEVLRLGENTIKVVCRDEGTRNHGARGKQKDDPGKIWYTPQSGIWQSVWLESMPTQHIGDFRIVPDVKDSKVRFFNLGETEVTITILDGEREIASCKAVEELEIAGEFEFWSPENPKLYNVLLKNDAGDEVASYFGMRSFGIGKDKNGVLRLMLNEKPYFFNGLLDQGYWSDGLLTYPSDQAALEELQLIKDMGFNTLRKHIKIEPMRWYYHCDRLGLIVWQDFVNGGGEYNPFHIAIMPFLGYKRRDNDYAYFARDDERGRQEFLNSVEETLEQLYNCPCIGVWVPFNEGWGQFDSAKVTALVREKDGSRIIDSVSGWHDQGVGNTELKSLHTYFTPLKVPKDPRPVVLSEFGGYSMCILGHVYNDKKEFGYKKFRDRQKLCNAMRKLYLKKLKPLIKKGLCGCIYTQVSDVEEEINGLITYDRQIVKVPIEFLKEINSEIDREALNCFE